MDEEQLVKRQRQLAGAKGIAKAEARFGKPLHELTDAELEIGTEEAINARKRFFYKINKDKPPEYYAFAAEGNRRCQERRNKRG